MRALLNVDVARHLGIVLLKPGKELMPLFSGGRVLVETLPEKMKALPTEEMARRSLRLKEEVFQSVYKESEIVPSVPATSILSPLVAKVARHPGPPAPVKPEVPVVVDPVAPATLFTRPKRIRWVSDGFISWVKTQPCMCCGQSADDAHHLIGWGQGGVGTKAHDIFTIPLCRKHHRTLHHDPVAFEREYGSQPELIIKLLDRAYALGVLA
ncbi:DUF968 domain-containing protein [Klebsiella aerogenes]|nr:DUF968 domain-containing protein [Klebsiella aerogenes]